jgi:isoquinoline 1-oxidoreductase
MPDTGSGYGGKHTGEAAIEAARLARGARRPVSLVWTRNEELTWAYFRPAGVIDVRAALDASGRITAWEFHNYNSGPSGIRSPYEIANQRIEFHGAKSPLRQGSYRGLAATANHFAREVHMDEMAAAAGVDPLAFRRKHLRDERIAGVLDAAATTFGWDSRKRASGRGYGLACGTEKGGYVATCAEVAIEGRDLRVARVAVAFECGAIVNPDGLKNQVEGAVVQGLGGALFEAIAFEDGRVVNARFADYRVPRFHDVPVIDTVLVNRPDLPSAGAGETPIVGIAPAIANAIFDATGVRLRALPLVPEGLPAASSSASADTGTTPPAAPRQRP